MSSSQPQQRELPNRAFGVVMAVALLALGIAIGWQRQHLLWWPEMLAALILITAAWRPAWLSPATRCWLWIGDWLHRIVSPITLGLLYFGIMTPLALALRLGRRDVLKRRFQPDNSYWVDRDPPGPDVAGLPRQF